MQQNTSEEIDRSDPKKFWTKDRLIETIRKIQKALKDKVSVQLRDRNPDALYRDMERRFEEFAKRYPTLFRFVVTQGDQLDEKRLSDLLMMYEKVRIKQIKEYDASVKVGYDLYNQYVGPNVKE